MSETFRNVLHDQNGNREVLRQARQNRLQCWRTTRGSSYCHEPHGGLGRLELEFGVTPTISHHSTEWDTDFLFKKPWTLSKKVEFMFGVGPEWIHIRQNGITTNSVAGEIALDFMFWPSPKRRFGWYIEPAYDYTFGRSHDQAISVSIGLLISVR